MKNERVKKVIAELAENFKPAIRAQYEATQHRILEEYKTLSATTGATDPHNVYPTSGNMQRSEYMLNRHKQGQVSKLLDYEQVPVDAWMGTKFREQHRFSVKPDVTKIIAAQGVKYADDAVLDFTYKMCAKLENIFDSREDLVESRLSGSPGHNYLRFTFANGDKFSMSNDIIVNVSVNGKPFNQYPTRFYDVEFDGKTAHRPSESIVKKLFTKPAVRA